MSGDSYGKKTMKKKQGDKSQPASAMD